MFALSPTVMHSIAFSVVLSIYFAKKINECKILINGVCLFLTAANAFGTPRPILGPQNSNDVIQLQNFINKH